MSRNNLNRKLKYSIRKKKNGGGAASFIVGSVVLGGLMLGGATTVNADEVTQTGTGTDTSAKSSGSTDISGTEVALSSPSNGKPAAPSNGKPAASTAAATESTADATTSAKNKTQPKTSATSESTPAITAGGATSEGNTDTSATTNDGNNAVTAQPTAAEVAKNVSITNVSLNKSVVRESKGTDLTITFDWEAKGLHKGDTMEVPMFEGFDSITKQVDFPVMSDGLKMGTLTLDYDARKINVNFTADLDPDKLYRGQMKIGTFVSRDYFKNLNNETAVQITLPDGTTVKQPLTVNFDDAPTYPISYEQATKQVMSDDKTQADVSWAVLINPQGEEMQQPTIYLTTNDIENANADYGQARIWYAASATPSTLDPSSIKLYEAQIYPSLGYTKGKQLTSGVDYEITEGDIDGMGRNMKDVWVVKLKGNYLNTHGQFVVEYNTHHDHLDPNASSGDSGAAVKTEVSNNGMFVYKDANNRIQVNDDGFFGAKIDLIDSNATVDDTYGSVDVKYVDTEGNILPGGDLKTVKDNAPVGEDYTTEKKSFVGYHFVRMDKTSDPATGVVAKGTKHVIYVYEKDPETPTPEVKKGSVDVKYVTTDGKVLEDVTSVKENAPVGEDYTTEEKTFDGYHFVGMDKTSDSANGKVTKGTKHVIYVYEKDPETPTPEVKKGSVDVKYVTTDGKVLEDVTSVKENAPVGEDYTTEEKTFDGYHFVGMDKTSDSANGKVTEGDKHVVYVYEKDVTPEVKKGSVDVKYVTTDGKVLEDVTKVKDNAPVGEAYTTEEKSFDDYHFVGMDKTSDAANGKVTEGDKHVVYVYEKDVTPEVKKGSVDVKYVTTDGKVLEDVTKVKDNAPVGEAYATEEKSFDGYHFVGMDKTSDSANGKVTEGDKHIVYVYEKDPEVPTTPVEKKGSVYVKYVDENGNELPGGEKITVVKDGKVGSYYFTTEKDFDGYTFSHMAEGSSDPTGKVVEGDQQVVYVYTKNNTPQPEPNKPEVPTTSETPAVPQEEKTTTDTPVKTSTSKVNAEKVTVNKATVLPQTGDKKENNSSVMGLVSLGLAGLLGLGIKRKEEKDNH